MAQCGTMLCNYMAQRCAALKRAVQIAETCAFVGRMYEYSALLHGIFLYNGYMGFAPGFALSQQAEKF